MSCSAELSMKITLTSLLSFRDKLESLNFSSFSDTDRGTIYTVMILSSDRYVFANSADPDQTAPRGAV